MATPIELNTTSWTEIGTGLTTAVIQISGRRGKVFIGGSAPADTALGYAVPNGVAVSVPSLSALGGGLWAKGVGSARYDAV
jgi:hypothetical protein